MGWFNKAVAVKPEIETETVQSARLQIGSERAWVERRGRQIKISYPWAGRLTKDDAYFYADDIRALARFVEETEPEQSA